MARIGRKLTSRGEASRRFRERNPDYHRKYARAWRKKHTERARATRRKANGKYRLTVKGKATDLLSRARQRARRFGREYALTKEWLVPLLTPMRCMATGVDLTFYSNQPNTPSIDRIDSSKGYTPDNCWVVAFSFNCAKGDRPLAEVLSQTTT